MSRDRRAPQAEPPIGELATGELATGELASPGMGDDEAWLAELGPDDDEELDDLEQDELMALVRSAAAPGSLGEADNDALVALALGDELAAGSDDEQDSVDRLVAALDGKGVHPLAELAEALRAAQGHGRGVRGAPDELASARAVHRALGQAVEGSPSAGQGGEVIALARARRRVAVLTTLVAVAAGVVLVFASRGMLGPEDVGALPTSASMTELIRSRSTQELFDPSAPFPKEGGESDRMDTIADARLSDLRANRFAAWGVP